MSTEHAATEHATNGQVRPDLRVEVGTVPEPGLLRPAIEAVLAGRAWPAGPEAVAAKAVAAWVAEAQQGGGSW